ncbi:MAG TPA: class I SAM-dependent methyltransferase, partial [Phototrophicaceae bacterium]|nr:class I SAM-dependent methyltransferase [Phototrophicaceae bacterium]
TDEYHQYKQVVLLDYSFTNLMDAQAQLGKSDRYIYVAADAYKLPFRPGIFDGASMVRVLHHMSDVPAVLAQVRRVMVTNGVFILEHANKQNLKAMVRYALKRQTWDPYDHTPVEFVELNFDFHPYYVADELRRAKFKLEQRIPVSFFRVETLKKVVPLSLLVGLDRMLQHTGMLYTPSIFTRNTAQGDAPDNLNITDLDSLFVCPESGTPLKREGDTLYSRQSGLRYAIRDGIYDFKAPLD